MIGYSKEQSAFKPPKVEKPKKQPKPIAKRSAKLQSEHLKYLKVRAVYLDAYPYCEVKECKSSSDQIHHKKGRIGSLLTDSDYFLAVCADCHSKIELEPIWAKENGYSITRL